MPLIARYDKSKTPWGPRSTGIYGHLPKYPKHEYHYDESLPPFENLVQGRRLHWWQRRVSYKGYLVLITKKHHYVFNYMGRQGYGSNKIFERL